LVSIAAKKFKYQAASFSIIDQDERYNENANIDATIKDTGCRSTKIHISNDGTIERLSRLIEYHDAPIATLTYLVHSMLSERIAADGYKVAISGNAADELFTGYFDHYNIHLYEMRNHPKYSEFLQDWQEHIQPIVRNPFLKDPDFYVKNPASRSHIYQEEEDFSKYLTGDFHEEFTEENYSGSMLRNRMLNELFHESIPVILHEDDLNSMMYSIENRSPYLDSKLFEFAYSIPPELLIQKGFNKYILREAGKGILNDTVRMDRRKRGFNVSIYSLIDFSRQEIKDIFLSDSAVFDFVNRDKIEELIKNRPSSNSFSKFLFNFINIKIFMDIRKKQSS
jgi:asparagine synthase (glutamine-hydrolysing)